MKPDRACNEPRSTTAARDLLLNNTPSWPHISAAYTMATTPWAPAAQLEIRPLPDPFWNSRFARVVRSAHLLQRRDDRQPNEEPLT
jgi:hypothetical protein